MFRSAAKRLRPVARGLGAAAAAGVGVAGAGQLHAQAERLPVAPPAGAPVALAAAADTQPAEPYEQLLYPAVEPFATARHETSDGHSLYYEQVGNPSGVPILFVHGGPGNGCGINDRRFFDPEYFRVILVDQRGCARSTPLGNLENNNIDALCDDFEAIREALGIEAWHVFGGSWGSTLSLYYAQQHPARCLSLTLRGIFLMRDQDVDYWMYQVGHTFPEEWKRFNEFIEPAQRTDLHAAYLRLLTGGEGRARAVEAAKAWATYELNCCTLVPNAAFAAAAEDDDAALALALMEAVYFRDCRPKLLEVRCS